MTDLRIAAFCYRYGSDRQDNIKTITRLLRKVEPTDIVLLPEDSAGLGENEGEPIPGPFTDWLQDEASYHGTTLIANLIEKTEEGQFSTCCIIDHTGHMIEKYRKIQLSHTDRNHRGLLPGNKPSIFTLNNISFGVAICYDVWYPEIIRIQALQGAQIIFAPFKEEVQFIPRVRALVSARAIENLVWIICCGGKSTGPGPSYHSFAWLVSPSGEIIHEAGNEEFMVYHLSDVEGSREREKALKSWNRPFDTQFGGIRGKGFSTVNTQNIKHKGVNNECNRRNNRNFH